MILSVSFLIKEQNNVREKKSFVRFFFFFQSFFNIDSCYGVMWKTEKEVIMKKSFNLSTQYFKSLDYSCQLKSIHLHLSLEKSFTLKYQLFLMLQKILNYIKLVIRWNITWLKQNFINVSNWLIIVRGRTFFFILA